MTMIEKLARIAAAEVGLDYGTLYEDKADYRADRGSRHDVNTPYKCDFAAAVRAILQELREPDEEALNASWANTVAATPEERMACELGDSLGAHKSKMRRRWQAMLDHILSH